MNKRLKQIVRQRARGRCEYCLAQEDFSPDPFSIEHIIPRKKKGSDDLENLAFCCDGCNGHKFTATTAEDPESGLEVPLFHPRRHIWSEHFKWSNNFQIVVGITPIGRATVTRLQLNRFGLQQIRRVMTLSGEHPPQ